MFFVEKEDVFLYKKIQSIFMDVEREKTIQALNEIYDELREKEITLEEFYQRLVPVVGQGEAQSRLEAELPPEFLDDDGNVCHLEY